MIGLSLLAYPTVSDQWNKIHQTRAIITHAENVAKLSAETCEKLFSEAKAFNASLPGMKNRWKLSKEDKKTYNSLLVSDETEVISYLEIPKIKLSLPVYHGTSDSVLQQAIGHMEGSSLPVGGKGTHCVLSGHRGLPSARLFTDLDQLTEGDKFYLYTLDQTLAYEVDKINIVLPTDISTLNINKNGDEVTLCTCTPYGVNTHRLMVHAHRIEESDMRVLLVTADAIQIDQRLVALSIAVPSLIILFLITVLRPRKKSGAVRKAVT